MTTVSSSLCCEGLIVLSDAFLKDGTLTSFRENISVAVIRVWVTGAVQMALSRPDLRDECNAVQVKYTNQNDELRFVNVSI